MMEKAILSALAGALLSVAPAAAVTSVNFTAVGQSQSISFNGLVDAIGSGQTAVPGLTADLSLTLIALGGSSATFNYALMNTGTAPIDASRVVLFGFDTDPTLSSATASGAFADVKSGMLPGVGGVSRSVDVCFRAATQGSGCTSVGAGAGVALGGTGSGSLTLNFASPLTGAGIILSDFHVRYQGIESTALGLSGGSGVGVPMTGVIPEPAAWAMMIAGFGLVGSALRRRRPAAAIAA